jgi:NADH dehydrogenase
MSQVHVPDTSLKFDVVIAGGGFAGVYCAQALGRTMGDEAQKRVALIAEENFMVFQPMLAEIAGSSLNPRHVVNPIRRLCKDVSVLRGKIKSIDYASRCLRVNAGDYTQDTQVEFDHLVLALGGVVDLSRVPGMAEHAYLMKNVGDALTLRAAVIDRFEEANLEDDPAELKRLLTIVIVGGGYSGVETAGQILDLCLQMLKSYPRLDPEALRIVLIHSGPYLLPEIGESLGRYAAKNLSDRGVHVVLNARVQAMTASRVKMDDGREIESHTVVSTVGNAPHPLVLDLAKQGVFKAEKGKVVTDAAMRVEGQPKLWAAGDCAAVPMHQKSNGHSAPAPGAAPKMGASPFTPRQYCPPTAQFAVRQGALLGRNIARALEGETELSEFKFTGLGELAAIGHNAAVAEIFGIQFHGFIAWWMWRTIYLSKLPGLERKLRVMIDWTLDLFFPRDITLFQVRPTNVVKQMHLEPGDAVFHAGDPALSLYVVQSGRLEVRDRQGAVLRSACAGDQLGRKTLLGDRVWPFSAVAVESSTLAVVNGDVFQTVMKAGVSVDDFLVPPPKKEDAPAAK